MKNDIIPTWRTIYKGTIAEGAACPYCGKRGYYHEDKCQYCGKHILPQTPNSLKAPFNSVNNRPSRSEYDGLVSINQRALRRSLT